jgi:hypothetical protein
MNDSEPFQRDEHVDKPGIIGARWWQEGLAQVDPVARRSALKTMVAAGIGLSIVGMGVALAAHSSSSSGKADGDLDDFRTDNHPALDMQREYGWNFGAATESLVFNGQSRSTFDKSALVNLQTDLAPMQSSLAPFFVSSLLQAPTALRKTTPAGDPDTFTPLKDALVPIFTPAMDVAYRRGRALAELFDAKRHPNLSSIAVIVDLLGPESVALAAGAASTGLGAFDPVVLFDNWPHPRGVVPSHLTLAACAYYQPLFAKMRSSIAKGATPLFLLDRARLTSYSDDSKQFDNRYVARLPSVSQLTKLGISRILYVTPTDSDLELEDLNDEFVYAVKQGEQVRAVAATSFASGTPITTTLANPDAGVSQDGPQYFYGGDHTMQEWFWKDYPWSTPYVPKGAPPLVEPSFYRSGRNYVPQPRVSAFSTGALSGSLTPPRPPTFGMVPVVVAAATGVILGAKMSRSGSWTRSSSWGGG